MSILNTFDPLTEFYKVIDLIELLIRVIRFLDSLLASIGEGITLEQQKLQDKISNMFSSLKGMIEKNITDSTQKEKMLASMSEEEDTLKMLLK